MSRPTDPRHRPPQPVTEYDGHVDYPSCEQAWPSRRSFLVGASATTAATFLAGFEDETAAAPRTADKRQRVTIHLDRYTQIGGSGLRAQKLDVFTGDKKLARFLKKYSEQRRMKTALMKRLRKVKPKTLYDGRKLYRLERSLGAIVAKRYRKATGRSRPQPDVMLSVTRYYRYRRMGGAMVMPRYPRRPRIRLKPKPKSKP